MRVRDVIPVWRIESLRDRLKKPNGPHGTHSRFNIDLNQPTRFDPLLRTINALPADFHGAGFCGTPPS